MANELRIKVRFEVDEAVQGAKKLTDEVVRGAQRKVESEEKATKRMADLQRQYYEKQFANRSKELDLQAKEMAALQAHLGKMETTVSEETKIWQDYVDKRVRGIQAIEAAEAKARIASAGKGGGLPDPRDIDKITRASANASVTLQALNYTVRDSAYFTRDFSLGILAVGNNLNPLIDGFIRMKQETGSYKGAMSALLGTLTGPAGVMFAFSIIVTLIQAFTFQLSKSKKEAQETSESFKNLSDKYRTFSEKLADTEEEMQKGGLKELGRVANAVTKELDSLNKELTDLLKTAMTFQNIPMGGLFAQLFGATPADIAKLLERMALLKNALEGGATKLGQNIFFAQTRPDKDLRKVFSDAELNAMASKLKEMGESLVPNMVGEFKVGTQVIQTTREEALKLAKVIGDIVSPPKPPSDNALKTLLLDLQGHAQVLSEELSKMYQKANELFYKDTPVLGAQEVSVADYRKDAQDRLKAIMDRFGISTMDRSSEKPKLGEDAQKYVDSLKDTGNELKVIKELSTGLSQSLYDAFMHSKKGVDEFIASLGVAIGKMLLMNAIQYGLGALFAPASLISAGGKGFGTIFGSRQQTPDIPLTAPIGITGTIAQRLDNVNENIAGMREPIIMIQADTDAIRFTREKVNPAQAKLRRGNVNVI